MLLDPKREAEIELEIKIAKEPWRKILLGAAARLRVHGHCKRIFSDELGRRCAIGAISDTSHEYSVPLYNEACRQLSQHIGKPIVVWNDMPANTSENVIATLERVAKQ